MELILTAAVFVSLVFCITAVHCFKIKYGNTREIETLRAEMIALHTKLDGIDAEAVKDLKAEVRVLRNHYGLATRK